MGKLEDRLRIQTDLDRLARRGANINLMTFNIEKFKVLHLRRKNPHHTYGFGSASLTSTTSKRDLGVLIVYKMNMSYQCDAAASKANKTLACIY